MNTLDNIEQKITVAAERACRACLKNEANNSKWTVAFKSSLSDLGEKLGFGTHASGVESAESEWLYDLTWHEYDQSNRLVSLPLVAEIEWRYHGLPGVKYDFEKLIQACAEHKVMIFETKNKAETESWVDSLKEYVQCFRQRIIHDRYLFLAYDWETYSITQYQLIR